MKTGKLFAGLLGALILIPGVLQAQQTSATATPAMTHLRVDFVLTEYSGDKKISSLPYTIYVRVTDPDHNDRESLRMGVKVPMVTSTQRTSQGDEIPTQINYEDVGTNIDCYAQSATDGRYQIAGNIDRSSVYSADVGSNGIEQPRISGGRPILRSFGSGFNLVLRDGETGEGVSATDPFNGHVLKVSVTIHVVK